MTIGSGLITSGIFSAADDMFTYADKRMALANRVTGQETPEQLAAIQQQDKQLALKQIQAEVRYEYYNAWQEQREQRRKKAREQHQRLFEMGAIFV